MQNTQFFDSSATNVDDIDTNVDDIGTSSPGAVVNSQRSDWRVHSCGPC